MKASRRIRIWLSDYDSRLEIHWSDACSGWVIERKNRVDQKLLAAFKERLAITYDTTESGTEKRQGIEHARLLAKMEIAAMQRGNRYQFAMPHPLDEEGLKRLIVETDLWRESSPEQVGAHKAVRDLTDPMYDAMAARRKERTRKLKALYHDRLRDYAPHFFRRLGLRTSSPGLKQAV